MTARRPLREQIEGNLREFAAATGEDVGRFRDLIDADCPKCGRFICDDRATCEGLRSRPAAAGEPVEAVASDGIVMILVDSATARQLAAAWKFAHGHGGIGDAHRPTYPLDVATILRAAIDADQQAGVELADVRYVPVVPTTDRPPFLRVVSP